ncbi:MAG: hypothetical protein ACPGYT_06720 [Nitrospirales bacterium]
MASLPEFVGTVHIFLGPYRGNPIALYLERDETTCHIAPRVYPWNRTIGSGETPNKAAAAFEAKWKEGDLTTEMYSGPHWEGGIKPEKPKPPPKPAAPKPAATATTDAPKPVAKPATTDAAKPSASSAAIPTKTTAPPSVAQPTKEVPPSAPESPSLGGTREFPAQTSTPPAASAPSKTDESAQNSPISEST